MAKRIFEKTFVIHEHGLELSDLEAPLLKADYIFRNPFSNKTLFFSRCKIRLMKMTWTKDETERKSYQYRLTFRFSKPSGKLSYYRKWQERLRMTSDR
jgi:hypothetical protein